MKRFSEVHSAHDGPRPALRHRLRRRPLGSYRYTRLRWRLLFALIDSVGRLAWGLARRVGLVQTNRAIEWPAPRSILVVQLDHLGDAILTTGLLRGLRAQWPEATIDVLCGAWNQELFAACPEVSRIFVSRVNRFARHGGAGWMLSILWWAWRLRRSRYDLGIDVRGESPLALLLWLSGVERRLGWNSGGGGFLLTDSPIYLPGRHEAASRGALLAALGIESPVEGAWRPAFDCQDAARDWMGRAVDRLGELRRPLVVLHVGAGTAAKRWPVAHWREVLGRLVVEQHARVVLVGSAEDQLTAQKITGHQPWPGVEDWTGVLDLARLAALLERAEVFVGADSGPAHLAAAVGAPVVALFSGTNHARQWRPWGTRTVVLRNPTSCSPCHRETCPLADHPCMSGLRPAAVMRAVNSILSARGRARPQREVARSPAIPEPTRAAA